MDPKLFNASLFLPFHRLNTLSMWDINIGGCVDDQCFEKLSELKKLEYLEFNSITFKNRSILSSIASISSLRSLWLLDIGLEGTEEIQWLSKLEKLEHLDLSFNNFNGTIDIQELIGNGTSLKNLSLAGNEIESFGGGYAEFKNFSNLELLDLRDNSLDNGILSSLNHCFSLKYLYIGYNKLQGSINLEGLSKLEKLEHLDLSFNNFNGTIDIQELIGNGTSLKNLSLAGNEIESFGGGGAAFQSFSNLESLDLWDNSLDNSILSSLNPCFSLKYLNIGFNKLQGSINLEELEALGNLEELDLSGNQIYRIVGSRGVNVNKNLTTLHLDNITLNGTSNVQLHSLGAYPHLKTIYLTYNQFKGPIFVEEGNLTNVKELYLDSSSLDKESFQSLSALLSLKHLSLQDVNTTQSAQGLSNLTKLEYLDMSFSSCAVESNFLKDIGMMISLETLILSDSGLKGTIEGLCELRHLEELHINYNELSGTLPWCIANLTSLKELDLSWNHFNGSIFPLRSLTSLQKLTISGNQFQVPISLKPFFNYSKLKYLDAGNNSQVYKDEEIDDGHNLSPKFQLRALFLSSPGNGEAFPKFLYHQHDLRDVDLSNIKFKEEFPYWLLVNNTELSSLYLANTSLSGPFQLPNNFAKYLLGILDISNNKFNSTMPTNIGQVLPRLTYLNLSENGFTGSIPSSFANMSSLTYLDLSNNRLSGEIPEDLYIGCFSLIQVILSQNNFQAQILPKQVNYLKQLDQLLLDDNQFTGDIPNSLLNSTRLLILDVSNNHLSGNVPRWIANMSYLQVLDLSNNSFFKNLPSHFCPHAIREIYLLHNQLHGSLENAFYNCSNLMKLDLSHNHLTGPIPKWMGNLTNLSYILLSYNQLQGTLPNELCNLSPLRLVDLSNNNMSGGLLSCFKFSSKYKPPEVEHHDYWLDLVFGMQRPLEITVKSITLEFRERPLDLITGIDFSCNNFTGEIPVEIGNLSIMKVLNLSHNSLIGTIPQSFVNLMDIESLDLSYNNLNGKIPPQLTQLHSVSVFSVAHNNLSGKTPEMVEQFATFENSSYEGNPLLCGLPLLKSCQTKDSPINSVEEEEEGGFIDMIDFYLSFLISYVIVLLSIGAVLYINPYWRRAWFYFIEVSLRNFYYFVEDIILALRKIRAS